MYRLYLTSDDELLFANVCANTDASASAGASARDRQHDAKVCKVYKSVHKYAQLLQRMKKYTKICKNYETFLQKYTKEYKIHT